MRNYALGCAFNLRHLLYNLPLKKLHIRSGRCIELTKDCHVKRLAARMFKVSYKLVINDIIDNNIVFHFPLNGTRKCIMGMQRFQGKVFKILRQAGKWEDVDIFKSMFSGCEICLQMLGNRTPRTKYVYVDKYLRKRITENTNNGMAYGDSKYDKTINDYYDKVQELFPDIDLHDIKIILKYAWKSLYLHNSYGGDVVIKDQTFWSYIGTLHSDSLKHFNYYIRKLIVKIRVMYRKKKIEWDGYYYFALTESQYQKVMQQKNKKGRPKRRFDYGTVFIYQIYDECNINEHGAKYIYRIPYISRLKIKCFVRNLVTDKAELIKVREPLKFKDVLINDNKYEFI